MECEHGPRKRSNALKRMAAMSGQKSKKIPNLTCPARLFVKKVKKFPQYRVPPDSDPKVVRGMQEHALKMVRSHGVTSGEIRYDDFLNSFDIISQSVSQRFVTPRIAEPTEEILKLESLL